MLIADPRIQKKIEVIIGQLTRDAALRQDLMQEALVHLWRTEQARPAQTLSWYVQSCRFHLQHVLSSGRSLDSRKRASHQVELPLELSSFCHPASLIVESQILDQVSAEDLLAVLMLRLPRRERQVLKLLVAGCNLGEVARQLKISYPTVLKSRRAIATQLGRLGVVLAPTGNLPHNSAAA
jgi:DNA-directed RNA polymerase specialized sigma24 family protein